MLALSLKLEKLKTFVEANLWQQIKPGAYLKT